MTTGARQQEIRSTRPSCGRTLKPESPFLRTPRSPATGPITVMIGDRTVTYDFLGLMPGSGGLVQLNLPIPEDLLNGNYAIKITIGEKFSSTPMIPTRR